MTLSNLSPKSGPTRSMAAWIEAAPRGWSDVALARAEAAFIDTVACMLAGADDPAARRARATTARWGAGEATICGTSARQAAPWAALANGTAAHALDYDDVLEIANAHVSAVLVPAILALGEERQASGEECLDALIVGVEIMARLGEAMNMTHYFLGWHTTLTLGTISAAAAAARLLKLDAARASAAISVAASMASGMKWQFGTMAKPIHAGLAAKNGILAASMAESGITAAEDIYEGERGFVALYAGTPIARLEAAMERLGAPPAIEQHGLWQKVYPCCASAHRPLDAILALRAETGIAPGAIDSIDAVVSQVAVQNLTYPAPEDAMQARFSMHYLLASALVDGDLSLDAFEPSALKRPQIRELLPKITMIADPGQPGDVGTDSTRHSAEVTLHLSDGSTLSRAVFDPRGHPQQAMDAVELAQKFMSCAERCLTQNEAKFVLTVLGDMRGLDRITKLTDRLSTHHDA
ncbi:MAG: MmgE/PrpD family protein [Proteobacteria bacterium]|nr:MmgE/PrpD family protein [Pseudomonadota bacterium]MDA1355966.1 MmgE/PrpD family protein [Pseudomonadota bacterium]